MHPNAVLAKELERCVATSDESLASCGLRKQLLLRSGDGFCLTPKGKDFVAQWGKPFTPKPSAPAPAREQKANMSPSMSPSTQRSLQSNQHQHSDRRYGNSADAGQGNFGRLDSSTRPTQFGRRPQSMTDNRLGNSQGRRFGS